MTLLDLQRDFRGWLTAEEPAGLATLGEGAVPGLAVYLNNYRGALMACLSESFAVVRAWLGDAAFEAAAASHIDRLPPHSWTLDAYALDFPETLDILYPDDPEVPELGRLERALGVAFVGPDAMPLDPAGLVDVDWDWAVLAFVPTLTLLPATTNAGAIWSAIMMEERPPAAEPLSVRTSIAVWRGGFTAAFRTLDPAEAEGLQAMREGMTFGALCDRLIASSGEAQGLALAGEMLGRWLAEGLVTRVS
jgi:hypothetical protein